jgi:disulfide oxidoreductase YuzD
MAVRARRNKYPAADSYLNLVYGETTVKKIVEELRSVPLRKFKIKGIFKGICAIVVRNQQLSCRERPKTIKEKIQLFPILLVGDEHIGKVIIADGYRRLCAVYPFDEDENIPCKFVHR